MTSHSPIQLAIFIFFSPSKVIAPFANALLRVDYTIINNAKEYCNSSFAEQSNNANN